MSDIVVTGATGTFGSEVARQLLAAGHTVRLLVRDPARLAPDLSGAQICIGQIGESDAVGKALEEVEAVFLASFDSPDQLDLQREFVKLAKSRGVRRIARISTDHVAENRHLQLFGWHYDCERMLEDSGVGYCHLRPSWVMQNFLSVPSVARGADGRVRVPAGEGQAGFVDARDVAAVAVEALATENYLGTALEITGPALINHREIAETISRVSGRPVAYEDLLPEAYSAELKGLGIGQTTVDTMLALFAQVRADEYAGLTDTVERVTGRPPHSFAEFARDHVAAFRAVAAPL